MAKSCSRQISILIARGASPEQQGAQGRKPDEAFGSEPDRRFGRLHSGAGRCTACPNTRELTGQPAPSVELAGDWRVAAPEGEPIDALYVIALVADEDSIWWEPVCALQFRNYSISGDTFTAPMRSNANLEGCDIGFPEELPQIVSVLEAADRIERTPENGVLISGNGRSVTLFSQ